MGRFTSRTPRRITAPPPRVKEGAEDGNETRVVAMIQPLVAACEVTSAVDCCHCGLGICFLTSGHYAPGEGMVEGVKPDVSENRYGGHGVAARWKW